MKRNKEAKRLRCIDFFCVVVLSVLVFSLSSPQLLAQESYTIKTGISVEHVPKNFYGTWRVSSRIIDTNNPEIFKEKNVDLWNLSRSGNVIKLENPFSGACASIQIDEVSQTLIKFKKVGDYDRKKLTDIVKLNLGKETFTGVNNLKLETISEVDGHVVKTEWATYKLTGEKISGASIK